MSAEAAEAAALGRLGGVGCLGWVLWLRAGEQAPDVCFGAVSVEASLYLVAANTMSSARPTVCPPQAAGEGSG